MRLTDYRTMLYLPQDLRARALRVSKRQKKSLAAVIREALRRYLDHPAEADSLRSLRAGFGLWRSRSETGLQFENRMRKQWKLRG
jgi:predicted DNA-binding protein